MHDPKQCLFCCCPSCSACIHLQTSKKTQTLKLEKNKSQDFADQKQGGLKGTFPLWLAHIALWLSLPFCFNGQQCHIPNCTYTKQISTVYFSKCQTCPLKNNLQLFEKHINIKLKCKTRKLSLFSEMEKKMIPADI